MSKRDHYGGIPKTRKVVMDANGTIRPLDKANKIPERVSVGAPGHEVLSYRDDGKLIQIYVDGINGDNKNDGLTSTTAFKDIQEVYRKESWELLEKSQVIINILNPTNTKLVYQIEGLYLANGGGTTGPALFRGPNMIQVSPATGPAILVNGLDTVPIVEINQQGDAGGNRTRFDCTAAAPGWTVNDFQGYFLRVSRPSSGGVKVIYEIPISENGSDFIVVDRSLTGLIQNTDTIEIVEPAVQLKGDVGGPNFGSVSVFGIPKFSELGFDSNTSTFERVEINLLRATASVSFDRCKFVGLSSFRYGNFRFRNCISQVTQMLSSSTAIDQRGRQDSAGDPINSQKGHGLLCFGIYVSTGSGGFLNVQNGGLSVYNSSGSGILADSPATYLRVDDAATIQGNNNAFYGIQVARGAYMRVPGGAATTISGNLGALNLQTGSPVEYGTGAGQFEEVSGWNGIFTRALEGTATSPTGDTSIITTLADKS